MTQFPESAAPPPPPPPPPPPTPPLPSTPTHAGRGMMIVLSYLWILAIVPLLLERDDREVQWHAKHGLVLLAAEVIAWIAFGMISTILSVVGPLGCLFGVLVPVLWLGILGLHIVCMVKGLHGERLSIPGISEYADRF